MIYRKVSLFEKDSHFEVESVDSNYGYNNDIYFSFTQGKPDLTNRFMVVEVEKVNWAKDKLMSKRRKELEKTIKDAQKQLAKLK